MGDFTDYTLHVNDASEVEKLAISKWSEEHIGLMNDWGDGWWCNAKWYEHDEDMKELSLLFPHLLFDLYGDGEDSDDMWHTYYKGGKMQHCPAEITFPVYDESKLE